MANQTTGLFETLVVPAATLACRALQYTKSYPESMFWEYQSHGGTIGQTMNVNVPKVVEADATDIGGGSISVSDTTHDTVPIVLDQHPSVAFAIKSWDKVRTPVDLQTLYLQPKMEALLRKINGYLAGLCTATNFNKYTPVTGVTGGFSRANLTDAWKNLAGAGVPVFDTGNLFLVTDQTAYATMLKDSNFYQEAIVGKDVAELTQRKAVFAPQLNAVVKFDQQCPLSTAKSTGLFFHRYALGGVCVQPPRLSVTGADIKEAVVFPFRNAPNFPVQIQMQSTVADQGTVIHLHAMYGAKVVRPDHGAILVAA